MSDNPEYNHRWYLANKKRLAAHKAWQQKHDLRYRLKSILATIRHRCDSPKFIGYKYYGGKGVRNFLTLDDLIFLWHRDGADKMKRPSIDRIDSTGHYELSNCRFIPLAVNVAKGTCKANRALCAAERMAKLTERKAS